MRSKVELLCLLAILVIFNGLGYKCQANYLNRTKSLADVCRVNPHLKECRSNADFLDKMKVIAHTQIPQRRPQADRRQWQHPSCPAYPLPTYSVSKCPVYPKSRPLSLDPKAPCPPPEGPGGCNNYIDQEIIKDIPLVINGTCGGGQKCSENECDTSKAVVLANLKYLEKKLEFVVNFKERVELMEDIIVKMEKEIENMPEKAPAGDSGPQGPEGNKGAEGYPGPPGRCLGSSFGTPEAGAPGPPGPRGVLGPEGDKKCGGCDGDNGEEGKEGSKTVGVVGHKGSKGDRGKNGSNRYYVKSL